MAGLYTLDENGDPKLCEDIRDWGKWVQDITNRRVKLTYLGKDKAGKRVYVSTVFIGIAVDLEAKKPLLFETRIFNGRFDQYQDQRATRVEALEAHKRAVNKVKNSQKKTSI